MGFPRKVLTISFPLRCSVTLTSCVTVRSLFPLSNLEPLLSHLYHQIQIHHSSLTKSSLKQRIAFLTQVLHAVYQKFFYCFLLPFPTSCSITAILHLLVLCTLTFLYYIHTQFSCVSSRSSHWLACSVQQLRV